MRMFAGWWLFDLAGFRRLLFHNNSPRCMPFCYIFVISSRQPSAAIIFAAARRFGDKNLSTPRKIGETVNRTAAPYFYCQPTRSNILTASG
jgi:hypothetical protein